MGDALAWLFGAAAFVPHGYCLLWRPDLVALHATSDAATAAAYFTIPAAILVLFYRRPDLDFPGLAILFATFILGCGLTHVADLLTLWWPIYIWDVDASTGVRDWSPEQKSILGLPPESVADPALFASLIHPEDRDRVVRAYRRAYDVDGGGHYRAQFRITRANDRAERWIEATGRVHFDETGKPVRGVGTLADVTEWRRTHIAL